MTTRIRRDIHRPSAIIPADYEFVAYSLREIRYLYDPAFMTIVGSEFTALAQHRQRTGGDYATHDHGGSCHVCGAHAIYLCVFYHKDTNSYIMTGEDCAAKLGMGDPERFRRLRDAITAAQKSRAGWKKAEGVLTLAGLKEVWDIFLLLRRPDRETLEGQLRTAGLAGDPAAVAALRDLYADRGIDPRCTPSVTGREEKVMMDIVEKLIKYGRATESQLSYLRKLLNDLKTRGERQDKAAEERGIKCPVPAGKWSGRVRVLKRDTKTRTISGYGNRRSRTETRLVMTVESLNDGWRIWGTVPVGCLDAKIGDVLELSATLEQSERDPCFGFFTFPTGRPVTQEVIPPARAALDVPVYDSRHFGNTPDWSRMFAEISGLDLGGRKMMDRLWSDSDVEGFAIRSARTGHLQRFVLVRVEMTPDNEIAAWHFEPVNGGMPKVTIYND
jgi:hypothetical protein